MTHFALTRRELLERTAALAAAVPLLHGSAAGAAAPARGRTFDVKAHGAVGDGLADDTKAIQDALTAARLAGGGTVRLPAGTYRVTADLVAGSRTLVSGAGRSEAVIRRDATPERVAVLRNHDTAPTGADTDITIEALGILRQGEASTANDPYDNAVQLRYVTRPAVRDCHVHGGGKGILFDACRRWRATGNRLEGFVDNGFASAAYAGARNEQGHGVFRNNSIGSPAPSGFVLGSSGVLTTQGSCEFVGNAFLDQASNAFEMGEARNLLIARNTARWSGRKGVHNSILIGGCADVEVLDNDVAKGDINVSYYEVRTHVNESVRVARNHVTLGAITLNSCRSATVAHNAVDRGMIVLNGVDEGLVHRNTVTRAESRSFWVLTDPAAPVATRRLLLWGNAGLDGNRAGHPGPAAAGFVVDGGDRISVVANVVADRRARRRQRYGLYVNATANLADRGNDFDRVATAERAAPTGPITYAGFDVPLAEGFPELLGSSGVP